MFGAAVDGTDMGGTDVLGTGADAVGNGDGGNGVGAVRAGKQAAVPSTQKAIKTSEKRSLFNEQSPETWEAGQPIGARQRVGRSQS